MDKENLDAVVARLDERSINQMKVIQGIANTCSKLEVSIDGLSESYQRIGPMDTQLLSLDKSLSTLWNKFDDHIKSHQEESISEKKEGRKFVLELAKLMIGALFGLLLAKLGVHLPS